MTPKKYLRLAAGLIAAMLVTAACSKSETVSSDTSVITLSSQNVEVIPAKHERIDRASETTTTLPDLSDVDSLQIQQQIIEDQEIARQMEIDEARDIHGKCGEWRELALSIGWPVEEWSTLSYVLYRESRCNVDSYNKTDPLSGSRGLMQINGYWCRPSQYSKAGWLQDLQILSTCDDLYDPVVNLKAGLAIWLYGEQKHGCGWRGPWATKCQ